jgi:hypothetical protein
VLDVVLLVNHLNHASEIVVLSLWQVLLIWPSSLLLTAWIVLLWWINRSVIIIESSFYKKERNKERKNEWKKERKKERKKVFNNYDIRHIMVYQWMHIHVPLLRCMVKCYNLIAMLRFYKDRQRKKVSRIYGLSQGIQVDPVPVIQKVFDSFEVILSISLSYVSQFIYGHAVTLTSSIQIFFL